jgi:uncharacterized integral membrane protein
MDLRAVPQAVSIVFEKNNYRLLAGFLSILFFVIYISVPVYAIPGNDFAFYFASTPLPEVGLSILLSIVMGMVFAMQIYSWRNRITVAKNASVGFAGFFSGAISAIFASATCASCISVLFSFIGFGGVVFLLEHRIEIMLVTAGIVMASFYYTSKKLTGKCKNCN